MKKNIFFITSLTLIIILFPRFIYAQGFSWAQVFTGAGIGSIVFDSSNNLYAVGGFSGTFDFDQSANTYFLGSANNTNSMFLLKQDASGNFIWAKAFPTLTPNSGWSGTASVSLDKTGNIYVSGNFKDSVDCDPNPLVTYSIKTNGSFHTFILKLDSTGNFIWAKHFGGNQPTGTNAVFGSAKLALNADFIYITSTISGTIDADPGSGIYTIASTTGTNAADFIIEKLDSAGNFIWAKQITGNNTKAAVIELDTMDNILATGLFKGTADFDPSSNVANLTSGSGGTSPLAPSDIFIAKYDSAGNYMWVKQIGDAGGQDVGHDIVIDNRQNILVTGHFGGTADFDPGVGVYTLTSNSTRSIFTLKLRNNGDFVWAQKAGPSVGLYEGDGIVTDTLGNAYVISHTYSTHKFDSSGNLLWTLAPVGTNSWIALDNDNAIYLSGNFSGTQDFDPGPGIYNLTGNSSGFIQKLCQSTSSTTLTASADTVCQGDTVYLTTPVIPGATRYYWERNNTFFTDTNTIAVTQSGNYRVTVYGGSCPLYSNYIYIVIALNPHPLISLSAPPSAPLGQPVTVTATLTYPGTNYTIDWYNNGALFSTTTTPSVTFTKQQPTAFISAILRPTVICYDTAVYSDTVTILTDSVTSVAAVTYSLPIQVYPNPFGNEVVINGLAAGDAILLLDATGRVLLKTEALNDKKVVDTKELALGYYVIKVLSKEGRMKGNVPVVKR